MNTVIWKYPLHDPVSEIYLPAMSQVLDIQMQGGMPVLWAMICPANPMVTRRFRAIMTGEDFNPAGLRYIRSVQDDDFVIHFYEVES